MNGMPSAAQISFSSPATSICSCRDSTTHGPGDQEQRLVEADFEAAELHRGGRSSDASADAARRPQSLGRCAPSGTRRWRSSAARTKPMNSGWPRAAWT